LIVSIRAGAVGLNLANANNVIICDPWWNPSHEDQAVGRVHRLGQVRDVNIYRFIMKNSIEERIEKMHEKKRVLANQVMMQKGSLENSKVSSAEELIKLLES
jgi:DNA repair protein RAD5